MNETTLDHGDNALEKKRLEILNHQAADLFCLWFESNVNQNENESRNASGGTCEGGAKRPHVGVFTRCVSDFVFILIYV